MLLHYCYVITLRYREKITVKYNYDGMGRQFVEERFCLTGELSAVPRGGLWGVQAPPPKFRRPSKIVPNSTRFVKTVKNCLI